MGKAGDRSFESSGFVRAIGFFGSREFLLWFMPTNVLMPQLGESIAEGTIVRWMKETGEFVGRDEPLFEITTDKVDAEVPSPAAGVLIDVRVQAGETVPVDSIVAVIAENPKEASSTGSVQNSSNDVGFQEPKTGEAVSIGRTLKESAPIHRLRVTPLVRRLALEHNVDLKDLAGTGSEGRITKADLMEFVEDRSTVTGSKLIDGDVIADADATGEPMPAIRRTIAEHMLLSRRTAAHVHTVFDVDFSVISVLRENHRDSYAEEGISLTYLGFIAKAVAMTIPEVPTINAKVSEDGQRVIYNEDVNLGIAVALDEGLVVPVIRRANQQSLRHISRSVIKLAKRARSQTLSVDDVGEGTFTITNPGAFGSIFGMPIIHQPQVAILCVGAVEKRPTVVDGSDRIEARPRCYLTLGFDHRLIDGAVADRFMSNLKSRLESFDSALL